MRPALTVLLMGKFRAVLPESHLSLALEPATLRTRLTPRSGRFPPASHAFQGSQGNRARGIMAQGPFKQAGCWSFQHKQYATRAGESPPRPQSPPTAGAITWEDVWGDV